MIEGTATDPKSARDTLLERYRGTVFEQDVTGSNPSWLLTLGVWHRKRRGFGQQFCPRCLEDDPEPYYRTYWRLAWITACNTHNCRLADRCDRCHAPCMPHRSRAPTCHECGRDRRAHPMIPILWPALLLQRHLSVAMNTGYFAPFGSRAVEPLTVFGTARQVVKIISSGRRSLGLRQAIAAHPRSAAYPSLLDSVGFDTGEEFEKLDVATRHAAMVFAARCFEGWPFMFAGYCGDARLWRSWAIKDRKSNELAFPYADAVERYLSHT